MPSYNEPASPAWTPSEQSRGWLFMGCAAVLLDAGLSAASLAASLFEGEGGGLTASRVLEGLAVFPQCGVLLAFLTLAKEVGDRGLWKASAGFFGASIFLPLFGLLFDDALPPDVRKGLAVFLGFALLALILVPFLPLRKIHGPGEADKSPAGQQGKGCLAGAIVPIIFILAKVFGRGLFRAKLGLDGWVAIEMAVLVLLVVGYAVWFAAAKIRLSDKLGRVAFWLGILEILGLVTTALGLAAFFALAAPALAAPAGPDEAALEALGKRILPYAISARLVGYVLWAALTAWLFLSIRKLGQRDWRFEFTGGARPWDQQT